MTRGIVLLFSLFFATDCDALRLPPDFGEEGGGKLQTSDCFRVLARFAFLQDSAGNNFKNLKYSFNYQNVSNKNLWLAVYNEPSHWRLKWYNDMSGNGAALADVLGEGMTCYERLQKAQKDALVLINMYDVANAVSCTDGSATLEGSLRINYDSYVWIAVMHVDAGFCNITGGVGCQGPLMDVDFSLHLTNTPENLRVFHHEISADESAFAYMSMAALVFGLANFLITVVVAIKLRKLGKWHYIPIGANIASLTYAMSAAFWVTHYSIYAAVGFPPTVTIGGITFFPLRMTAQFFWLITDECVVIICLVLGKGWTLIRKKLSPRSRAFYGVMVTVYIFFGWAGIVWSSTTSTQASSVSFWDQPAGLLMVGARIVIWFFYMWAISTTIRSFQQKKGFFRKLVAISSIWFLQMPFMLAISLGMLPVYRFGTVQGVNMMCLCLALLVINIMYWPNIRLSRGFPFHSFHQVNMMNDKTLAKILDNEGKGEEDMTAEEKKIKHKAEKKAHALMKDPLSRLCEQLAQYQQQAQLCADFASEIRIGLREIDELNEKADIYDEKRRARQREKELLENEKDSSKSRGGRRSRRGQSRKREDEVDNVESFDDNDEDTRSLEERDNTNKTRRRRSRRSANPRPSSPAEAENETGEATSEAKTGDDEQNERRRRRTRRSRSQAPIDEQDNEQEDDGNSGRRTRRTRTRRRRGDV